MSQSGDDDDDRVLGLTARDPKVTSADINNFEKEKEDDEQKEEGEGEGEEMFLDLGMPSDENDNDNDNSDNENGVTSDKEEEKESNHSESLSDDALIQIQDKSEAKALGKDMYKRWKKLRRRSSKKEKQRSHRHESKTKKSKKDKKESNKRKDKEESKKNSKRKRKEKDYDIESDDDDDFYDNDDDDDDEKNVRDGKKKKRSRRERPISLGDEDLGAAPFADLDEVLQAEEAAVRRTTNNNNKNINRNNSSGGKGSGSAGETRPKRITADGQRDIFRTMAKNVVTAMREARLKDEVEMNQHRPPLYRVSIREEVIAQCRREALRPYLIEEGILKELSTWLYDFTRRELAAYELRSSALDILLQFPIDGELDTSTASNGDDILDAFTGMTREHLINTDLGSAVNALRQEKLEVHQNRVKAVQLLERLSRAMAGGVKGARRGNGEGNTHRSISSSSSGLGGGAIMSSNVTWKCQNDPTVAPPFHVVQTGTEVFQSALVRPDPLDPLSYLRVPPRRAPKAYVTNLGGNVGVEKKQRE